LSPPSASSASSFLVARHGHVVYVRAVGLANMKNAPVLDAFLGAEVDARIHTVCIDLSACTGMDSTFMGLLVGSAQRVRPHGGKLVVVNPTEQNLKLLRLLGLADVLPVLEGCELPVLEFVSLSGSPNLSQLQRMELVKRAHQNLVALNETNKAKFTAFLAALEADLAKLGRKDPE
jgi:anti-anti-sigma factor